MIKKTGRTTKTTSTAGEAYSIQSKLMYTQTRRLDALRCDDSRFSTRAINWADVGDLAHVNELLARAVDFLSGTTK